MTGAIVSLVAIVLAVHDYSVGLFGWTIVDCLIVAAVYLAGR